jgi:hypothetical protein
MFVYQKRGYLSAWRLQGPKEGCPNSMLPGGS